MELGLGGRVVVITGGSSGIGKAAALEHLKEGCKVAICARGKERLEQTVQEFQSLGYEVFSRSVDVTDYAAVEDFADAVAERYGKIDVWYNNAAVNQMKLLMDYSYDEFRDMTERVLVSVFAGCKIAAERMKKTGGGVIMNASSFSAVLPNAGRAPYSACKAGVQSLTQTFAAELAPYHIRVLAYTPGLIETEITKKNIALNGPSLMKDIPCRRFGQPEDLARVLVFLTSDVAGYINGTDVRIAGGKFCTQNPQYGWEHVTDI